MTCAQCEAWDKELTSAEESGMYLLCRLVELSHDDYILLECKNCQTPYLWHLHETHWSVGEELKIFCAPISQKQKYELLKKSNDGLNGYAFQDFIDYKLHKIT